MYAFTFLLYKSKPWCLNIFLRYKTVHILFPACTRVYAFTFLLYKSKPWCLNIFLHYKTVHILFPACTRVYAFTARCTYVQRIGLRGLGVVPTVDIAHYEYHYLSSCACAENRAIAPLIIRLLLSNQLILERGFVIIHGK